MSEKMHTGPRAFLSVLVIVVAPFLATLAGCSGSPPPTSPTPVESPATAVASTTATSPTPSPAQTPIGPATAPITLTIWGPEQFGPREGNAGAGVLQAQYQAFTEENPDIGVEYVRKAPYGQVGVQRFLLLASYAAPDTLPDVALVDPFELGSLVRAGLAQPLQELIAEELRADLFPFAQEACTFDDNLMALQFEADTEHLIYYTKGLAAPPATWGELFGSPISYIFPASGQEGLVNDAFLIQYFDQGGQLVDAEGRPALDESAVRQVLRLYNAGVNFEVVPPEVLELANLEDCWEAYIEGNITVSHISSLRYLASRDLLEDTAFAPLPTATGRTATMSRGWAFVLVTADPQRQQAAAHLIEWLMSPENLAEWSFATNHLPARRSALPLVGWPRSYADFLETQLEIAFFRPSTPEFERIARALQVAVKDVLSGERSPWDATSRVTSSLD